MSKKARRITVWVMLFLMVASIVGGLLAYILL